MYGFSPDCSVLYNGPKGKENREGNRRIEKKEENKGEDQTDVIDMSRTYTHARTHALREMKFIKTRNWLPRLSETYNSKRELFNA